MNQLKTRIRNGILCSLLFPSAALASVSSSASASATNVATNPYFAYYSQCAASTSGAQGTTVQNAYMLGSDIQRNLKKCMKDAKDTKDLAIFQAIESCLQSSSVNGNAASASSSSTNVSGQNNLASSSSSSSPVSSIAGGSASSVASNSSTSSSPLDIFRACRKQASKN